MAEAIAGNTKWDTAEDTRTTLGLSGDVLLGGKRKKLTVVYFSRVKVATRNFSDIIGLGAFGYTYKVINTYMYIFR